MPDNFDQQNLQATSGGRSRVSRIAMVAVGTGLGAMFAYLVSRMIGKRDERSLPRHVPDHIVDDQGTGQEKAARILLNLRDRAFEASDEKLALALGRPVEEITAWNAGIEIIDDDVVMKARGIAMHRGVHVE